MKIHQKILLIAIVFGIISTIANSLQYNLIMLFFRQFTIPLLIYYCYKSVNKISILGIIVLILNWFSDWVNFTSLKNLDLLFVIGISYYILLLFEVLQNSVKFKTTFINVLSLTIVVLSIGVLYFYVIDLAMLELNKHKILFFTYAFVLALLIIFGAYNLNYRNSNNDLNFFFCAATFFISDIFYLMNEFFVKYQLVVILNFLAQLLSYYFITRYFLFKEKNKNLDQTTMLFP